MATSGTHTFNLDLPQIAEEAYERIGFEVRTGYDYRSARRSLDLLLLEWQNKGLNLWAIKEATQVLTAGTLEYTLSNEKLDIIEAVLRTDAGSTTSQVDLTMERVSVSHYAQQTNKLTTGRPIQYWVEQTPTGIVVTVWPVPNTVTTYNFHYWYMERIEDTGTPGTNVVDVPARYLPVLTAGLAYYIRMKTPNATTPLETLKAIYDEQWNLAADSSREKASLRIVPGGYRR